MYEPDTTLLLKEQRPNDPETDEPFPYNKVRVIGPSPVSHADKGDWTGTNANGVLVVPVSNFGATLDEPYGKLRQLYDVDEIPVRETDAQPKVRIINSSSESAGPTPEEVFAVKAPGKPPEEGQTRARTSPLLDPGPEGHDGPLGKTEAPEREVEPTREDESPI